MPMSDGDLGTDSVPQASAGAGSAERTRWSLITELVGEAWNLEPAQRAAYLAESCGGDYALLNEVHALLGERESVSGFLECPAFGEERLTNGATLGSYIIEEKIGEGGMGVVYRGRDDRLERSVAIKVVRFFGGPEQRHREQFLHEARTTAALNHPDIVTIYDVGTTADDDFIVMEYVQGNTLDRLLDKRGALDLAEVLRIGEHVADALAYAHDQRIIHRDLKPGNIILTESGGIKILDFGLAKQLGRSNVPSDEAARGGQTPRSTMSSLWGNVAGTVSYMAPEQAEGAKVDERSDLFSFGCVLFEMITGQKAFRGADAAETLAKIRKAEHRSIRALVPGLPLELATVVGGCLELDPQRRPHSAGEVGAVLKRARATIEGRGRRLKQVVLISAGLVLAGLLAASLRDPSRSRASGPTLHALPLTGDVASEFTPSVSPDGRSVAYAAQGSQANRRQIFVRAVRGGVSRSLTSGSQDDMNPSWSPDGTRVAFRRVSESAGTEVWTVGTDGGAEQRAGIISRFMEVTHRGLLCWPKDQWLIVSGRSSPGEAAALYRLTIETGEQVRITEPVPKSLGDFSPQVSRGGRFLAFVRVSTWNNSSIHVQPLTGSLLPDGPPRRIDTGALRPSSVAWTFEGDELVFTAGFADHSLWRIGLGQGQTPRRLDIVGADDGLGPSASAGDTMAFARVREEAQIWRLDLTSKQASVTEPLISSLRMNLRPQYSPDGERVSFISLRSGYAEIWVADAGGLKPAAVTSNSDPSTGDPFWSPDGKFLAFNAAPGGQYDIYRLSATGGTSVQLTRDPAMDMQPSWSRDGHWIYFASNRSGAFHIYKVPPEGGEAVRVTTHPGFATTESPDGSHLYFTESDASVTRLWRLDKHTGREEPLNVSLRTRNFVPVPDGIYFESPSSSDTRPEIRFLSLQSMKTTSVHQLEDDPPPGLLSMSPDGRFLLFTKYKYDSHVMVVNGFR